MAVKNEKSEYTMYRGRPLVRSGHTIYYGDPGQDYVVLMTLHSAKGLEYPVVFVVDANEGIVPHHKAGLPADIEEERRLFYVALTRAKDRLHVAAVKERYHRKTDVSRFVEEAGL